MHGHIRRHTGPSRHAAGIGHDQLCASAMPTSQSLYHRVCLMHFDLWLVLLLSILLHLTHTDALAEMMNSASQLPRCDMLFAPHRQEGALLNSRGSHHIGSNSTQSHKSADTSASAMANHSKVDDKNPQQQQQQQHQHHYPVRMLGQKNTYNCTLSTLDDWTRSSAGNGQQRQEPPSRRSRTAHMLIGLPETHLQEPLHPRQSLYFRNMTHSYRAWHSDELPFRQTHRDNMDGNVAMPSRSDATMDRNVDTSDDAFQLRDHANNKKKNSNNNNDKKHEMDHDMYTTVAVYDTHPASPSHRHGPSLSLQPQGMWEWLFSSRDAWMHTLRQLRYTIGHYTWYHLSALIRLFCQRHITLQVVVDWWSEEPNPPHNRPHRDDVHLDNRTAFTSLAVLRRRARANRLATMEMLRLVVYPPSPRVYTSGVTTPVKEENPISHTPPRAHTGSKAHVAIHRHTTTGESDTDRDDVTYATHDENEGTHDPCNKEDDADDMVVDNSISSIRNHSDTNLEAGDNGHTHSLSDNNYDHPRARRAVYLECDYDTIRVARRHLRERADEEEEEEEGYDDEDAYDDDVAEMDSHKVTLRVPTAGGALRNTNDDEDEEYEEDDNLIAMHGLEDDNYKDEDEDVHAYMPRRRRRAYAAEQRRSKNRTWLLRLWRWIAQTLQRRRARTLAADSVLSTAFAKNRRGRAAAAAAAAGLPLASSSNAERWSPSQHAAAALLRDYVREELGPYVPTQSSLVSSSVRYVLGRQLYHARHYVTETTTTTKTIETSSAMSQRQEAGANTVCAQEGWDHAPNKVRHTEQQQKQQQQSNLLEPSDRLSSSSFSRSSSSSTHVMRQTTEWRLFYEMTLPATRSLCLAMQALPPTRRRVLRTARRSSAPLRRATGAHGHALDDDEKDDSNNNNNNDVVSNTPRDAPLRILRVSEELRLDTVWLRLALLALLLSFIRPYTEYSMAMHVVVAALGGVLLLLSLLLLYTLRELRRMTIGRAGLYLMLGLGGVTAVLEGLLSALTHTAQESGVSALRSWLHGEAHTNRLDGSSYYSSSSLVSLLWCVAAAGLVLGGVGVCVVRWLVPPALMRSSMHGVYGGALAVVRLAMWVVNREATALYALMWFMWWAVSWYGSDGENQSTRAGLPKCNNTNNSATESKWRRENSGRSAASAQTMNCRMPASSVSKSKTVHNRKGYPMNENDDYSSDTDLYSRSSAHHPHTRRSSSSNRVDSEDESDDLWGIVSSSSWWTSLFGLRAPAASRRGRSNWLGSTRTSVKEAASAAANHKDNAEVLHDPESVLPAAARRSRAYVRPLAMEGQVMGATTMTRAGRLREYELSGAQHTRRALEELARHVREHPGRYAERLRDPNSLQRWAGAAEESEESEDYEDSSAGGQGVVR